MVCFHLLKLSISQKTPRCSWPDCYLSFQYHRFLREHIWNVVNWDHISNKSVKTISLFDWVQLSRYVLDVHLGNLTNPLKGSLADFSAVVWNSSPLYLNNALCLLLTNFIFPLLDCRTWYTPTAVWFFLYDTVYSGIPILVYWMLDPSRTKVLMIYVGFSSWFSTYERQKHHLMPHLIHIRELHILLRWKPVPIFLSLWMHLVKFSCVNTQYPCRIFLTTQPAHQFSVPLDVKCHHLVISRS